MKETRIIRDGRCSCTHSQTGHAPMGGLAQGQGRCTVKGCACKKFTWVGWAEKEREA